MKQSLKILSVVVALLLALCFMIGCTTNQQDSSVEGNSGSAQEEKKIAMLLVHLQGKRFLSADAPAFEEKAKELGYTPIVQSAEGNSETQIKQAESVIMQGVKAIVLQPYNYQAAQKIVEIAHEAGVVVVCYNDAVQNTPVDGFVGRNSYELGVISAEKMLETYPTGNYILCCGDEGAGIAQDMHRGYLDVLQDCPDVTIVSDQFNKDTAAQHALVQIETALVANDNNISAILSGYDGMSIAALQALSAVELNGKVGLSGQDFELAAAQAILSGDMTFTAFTEFWQMGSDAAELAISLAEGSELPAHTFLDNGSGVEIPWIETPLVLIDKDNIADFVLSHEWWLSVDEVYANVPQDQWPTK